MHTVERNPKKDWNPKTATILYRGAKRDNGEKGVGKWDLENSTVRKWNQKETWTAACKITRQNQLDNKIRHVPDARPKVNMSPNKEDRGERSGYLRWKTVCVGDE